MFKKNCTFIKNNKNFIINSGFCAYTNNYLFVKSKEDSYSLVLTKDNINTTIHSRFYPIKEAKKNILTFTTNAETIVVLGYGLGYYVDALSKIYKNIIVVEPDKKLFNNALKLYDFSKKNTNITYIVGFLPRQAYQKIKNKNYEIFKNKQLLKANTAYYGALLKLINNDVSFDMNYIEYKKFAGPNIKVALLVDGHVLANETIIALKSLGCLVEVINMQSLNLSYSQFIDNMQNFIAKFKPDFFININHFALDENNILAKLLTKNKIPFVSWFVDSPTVLLSENYINSDYFNIFVWDRTYILPLKKIGYSNVDFLPLATCPKIFYNINVKKRYNIGFVGSSLNNVIHKNVKSFIHRHSLLANLQPIALQVLKNKTINVHQFCQSLNFDNKNQQLDFEAAVLWKAAQIKRLNALNMIANYNPTICGDNNWDNILNYKFNVQRELNYNTQLNSFYNECEINFNVTSCQMLDAVNQRVFDVAAGANFLISDFMPQLQEFFEKDEAVYYTDVLEIPQLIDFYKNNESERQKIAQKAQNRVLNAHTYKHRYKKMIDILKNRFA